MNLYTIILFIFVGLTAISAFALVLSRNVFYSAMYVIVCLLSLAGIYVLLYAEFVAVTQILVYAGGVLVIIIFGIMLTAKLGSKPLQVAHGNVFTGILLAVPLFLLLSYALESQTLLPATPASVPSHETAIEGIGISLMSSYVLAFEVAGLLLLIALIGAAVVASKPKSNPE